MIIYVNYSASLHEIIEIWIGYILVTIQLLGVTFLTVYRPAQCEV